MILWDIRNLYNFTNKDWFLYWLLFSTLKFKMIDVLSKSKFVWSCKYEICLFTFVNIGKIKWIFQIHVYFDVFWFHSYMWSTNRRLVAQSLDYQTLDLSWVRFPASSLRVLSLWKMISDLPSFPHASRI